MIYSTRVACLITVLLLRLRQYILLNLSRMIGTEATCALELLTEVLASLMAITGNEVSSMTENRDHVLSTQTDL